MPAGNFFSQVYSAGVTTTSQEGKPQVFAVLNAGGEEVIWYGPLPMNPGDDFPWTIEALLLMGLGEFPRVEGRLDLRRISELPSKKRIVKVGVKAREDGYPGYKIYINDPHAAPKFRQASEDLINNAMGLMPPVAAPAGQGARGGGNRNGGSGGNSDGDPFGGR